MKQKLHTMGYSLADVKPVDLCTLSYHHLAQRPSIGFGPASHLNKFGFETCHAHRLNYNAMGELKIHACILQISCIMHQIGTYEFSTQSEKIFYEGSFK